MRILVALALIAGTQACIGGLGGGGGCCAPPAPACGNPCGGGFRGPPIGGGYAAAPIAPLAPIGAPLGSYASPPLGIPPPPSIAAPPPPPPPPASSYGPASIGGGVQPIPLFGQTVGAQAPQGYAVPSAGGFQPSPQVSGFGGGQAGGFPQPAGGFGAPQAVANFAPQQVPALAAGGFAPQPAASQPAGGYIQPQPSGNAQAVQAPIPQQIPGAGGSYQEGPSPVQTGGATATSGEQHYDDLQPGGGDSSHSSGNYQTHPQPAPIAPSVDIPAVTVHVAPQPVQPTQTTETEYEEETEPESPQPVRPVPAQPSQPSAPQPSVSQPSAPQPAAPQPTAPQVQPAAPAPNTVSETEEGGEEYGDEEPPTEDKPAPSQPSGPAPSGPSGPAPPRAPIQPSIQPTQPAPSQSQSVVPSGPAPSQPHTSTHEIPVSGSQEQSHSSQEQSHSSQEGGSSQETGGQETGASNEVPAPTAPQTHAGGLDFNKVHEDLSASKTRSTIPGATRFTTAAPAPTTGAIDTAGGDEDYSDLNAESQTPTDAGDGANHETANVPSSSSQPSRPAPSSSGSPSSSSPGSSSGSSSSSGAKPRVEVAPAGTNTRGSGSSSGSSSRPSGSGSNASAGSNHSGPSSSGSSSSSSESNHGPSSPSSGSNGPSSGGSGTDVDSLDGGSDYDSVPPAHEEHSSAPHPASSFNGGGNKATPAPTQEIVDPQGFDYGAGSDYHEPEKNDPKIVNSENEAKATGGDNAYPENRVAGTRQLSVSPIKADTSLYPVEHSYRMRRMRRA